MNAWAYLAIHDAAGLFSGAYLATHDCPWWAALVFFMVAATTVNNVSKS